MWELSAKWLLVETYVLGAQCISEESAVKTEFNRFNRKFNALSFRVFLKVMPPDCKTKENCT